MATLDSPVRNLSYEELTSWANLQSGYKLDEYLSYINATYPDADLTDFMIDSTGAYLDFYDMGDGTYTVTGFKDVAEVTTQANPINSNVSSVSRGGIKYAINNGVQNVGGAITRNMTRFPASGSFAQRATYVLGSVGGAIGAVTTGIALGKMIDGALYNANPDYWDSIGMSSLNPETWNSITNGSDSPFAGLFNFILGLDPDTGNSQAYMDANALAYMAMVLNQNGWFSNGAYEFPNTQTTGSYNYTSCITLNEAIELFTSNYTPYENMQTALNNVKSLYGNYYVIRMSNAVTNFTPTPSSYSATSTVFFCVESLTNPINLNTTLNAKDISIAQQVSVSNPSINGISNVVINSNRNVKPYVGSTGVNSDLWQTINTCGGIDITISSSIDGVSNQDNATLPDTSNWNDLASTLASLQQQYPDMWNNALQYDSIQPNGNVVTTTYVPVPMPEATYNNDPQPTSGNSTQAQTQVDPTLSTQTLLQLLADIIQAPQTQTATQTETPPQNPVDTGTGTTPTPILPVGNASALWSVYHPTQAQVNSFGAWLWGSPFLTNIGKLFQNPIDGVISLHKIFAMPVDSGTGNIVVGTLDSGVSSATVNQQYVTVDCGSVNCMEDFGNVFDYPPFTSASIYLPFIGIVPIDVNDVMRSTVHVTYGVDVYTGACLAMVEVTRDAYTVNMYQYAGVASVEYPLSNVQNGQLVSGLLAIGAGVASMVATGGVTAPAVGAVAGGIAAGAKSNVGKSGGFSGNAGAMGIKKPYLILQRPQTKVANTFPEIEGYPTNYSCKLGDCSNQVVVKSVHVEGIPATDAELTQIESLLKEGVLI